MHQTQAARGASLGHLHAQRPGILLLSLYAAFIWRLDQATGNNMATEEKVALITGITGQDGSYLTELLLSKGYTVSAYIDS